jgi:hypothetical protein
MSERASNTNLDDVVAAAAAAENYHQFQQNL